MTPAEIETFQTFMLVTLTFCVIVPPLFVEWLVRH
jgi:hypothetical protein